MILTLLLVGDPAVLPPESLEVLWGTWQLPEPVWIQEAAPEDLARFPLFSDSDVRGILQARQAGPFRSWEDFFRRTGLSPDLRPFLDSWLLLKPRDNLSFRVLASTATRPRVSGKVSGHTWSFWSQVRMADTSYRWVFSSRWLHAGTFRPITGWTGPFPRSLWSRLRMPEEEPGHPRMDSTFRIWLHPRWGDWRWDLVWPDSLIGVGFRRHFWIWYAPHQKNVWAGVRTGFLGMELLPETTGTHTLSLVGLYAGEALRWIWRWSPLREEHETRLSLRFPSWGIRLQWVGTPEDVSLRGYVSIRTEHLRVYGGLWEGGGWIRLVQSPWSWKWGVSEGVHRVEIRYSRSWGFLRAGMVSEPAHLWWMHASVPVSSGYGEFGVRRNWGDWQILLRGLGVAGPSPMVELGGEVRWHGYVSW